MATEAGTRSGPRAQNLITTPRPPEPGQPVVERYPLRFEPESTTRPNARLLPAEHELAGMELAYRERPSDALFDSVVMATVPVAYLAALVVVVGGPLFYFGVRQTLVPRETGLAIAAALGVLAFVRKLYLREFSAFSLGLSLVGPPVAALAIYSVVGSGVRLQSSAVLAAITFGLYWWLGAAPFCFERDWLYTAPQLRPETRRRHPHEQPTATAPDLALLALVLALAVFGPLYSSRLALVAMLLACAAAIGRDGRHALAGGTAALAAALWFSRVSVVGAFFAVVAVAIAALVARPLELRALGAVLSRFFNYGQAGVLAPGMWVPERPFLTLRETLDLLATKSGRRVTAPSGAARGERLPYDRLSRRATLWCLTTPLFVTLAVALSLYFPFDILRGEIQRVYLTSFGDAYPRFERYPYVWAYFALERIRYGNLPYLWCFALAFLVSLVTAPTVVVAVYRRPLREIERLRRTIDGFRTAEGDWQPGLDDDERTEWEWYVDRLRRSDHVATGPHGETVAEAEHLFLGVEPGLGYPILLHERILGEHAHFLGASGGGKTARGITPILIQLIRGHHVTGSARMAGGLPARDDSGLELSPPPPLVVLDLKGDPALFQTLRAEVERRRWRDPVTGAERRSEFRFFTAVSGYASDYFNPFQTFDPSRRSLPQLCEILLEALELAHGPGYGRTFYTGQSRQALLLALEQLLGGRSRRRGGEVALEPLTFTQLAAALRGLQPRERKNAEELIAAVTALTYYDQLVTTREREVSERDRLIHMPTLLANRQVAYFWLPAAEESVSSRQIGRLAISALFAAARDREVGERCQAYVVIDEFQQLVSRGFAMFQEQMRQFRVGLLLANQSKAALRTPDGDLTETIETSVRFAQDFAPTSHRARQEAVEASGQEIAITKGWSSESTEITWFHEIGGHRSPHCLGHTEPAAINVSTWAETLKPRFMYNDVAEIADHPLDVLTTVSRGEGYTQFAGLPFRLRTTFAISRDLFDERERAGWPRPAPGQVVGTESQEAVDRVADAAALALEDEIEHLRRETRRSGSEEIAAVTTGQPRPNRPKPERRQPRPSPKQPARERRRTPKPRDDEPET